MSLDRKTAARVLREAAALLEVQGENVHRVRALANASRIVERIEGDPAYLMRNQFMIEEQLEMQRNGRRLMESRPW